MLGDLTSWSALTNLICREVYTDVSVLAIGALRVHAAVIRCKGRRWFCPLCEVIIYPVRQARHSCLASVQVVPLPESLGDRTGMLLVIAFCCSLLTLPVEPPHFLGPDVVGRRVGFPYLFASGALAAGVAQADVLSSEVGPSGA